MRIIDIGIDELDSARRRGRSRSSEMVDLISTIEKMSLNEAKAIIATDGKSVQQLRSRLLYAGRVAGKRLQIGVNEGKLIFALDPRPRKRRDR